MRVFISSLLVNFEFMIPPLPIKKIFLAPIFLRFLVMSRATFPFPIIQILSPIYL